MRPLFTPKLLQHAAQLFQTDSRNEYMYGIDQLSLLPKQLQYLFNITSGLCSDAIGDDYLEYIIQAVFDHPDKMDMLIITDSLLTTEEPEWLNHITGFIITEQGYCPSMPEAHSVQLICSPYNKGSLLMCVFLTAIVRNTSVLHKKAILELSDGPVNIAGLCMYSKFGFRYDPSLFQNKCFSDIDNLPMTCDIRKEYTIESPSAVETQLKYIFFGEKGSFRLPQKDQLCAIQDNRLQLLLAMMDIVINSMEQNISISDKTTTFEHAIGWIRYDPILKWAQLNGLDNLKTVRQYPDLHSKHIKSLLRHTQAINSSDFPNTFQPKPFSMTTHSYRQSWSARNSAAYKTHKKKSKAYKITRRRH